MDSVVIGSHTGNPAASHLNTAKSNFTISVKDLLDIVKENYPEMLSDNFREHYGVTVPKAEGLLFSDRDSNYFDAIKRGDMETVQRMVDEDAKKAGFPVKLFHGTAKFGFTKVDVTQSDDGISFFV